MPRSTRSSSRSRYDNPNRRYQHTRQENHLGREPVASERRQLRHGQRKMTTTLHLDTLAAHHAISQRNSARCDGSRPDADERPYRGEAVHAHT
jgi:hypothetical protein